MAAPNSVGPLVGGTARPAQSVVAAYGALVGDGSPQGRGPTGWGDAAYGVPLGDGSPKGRGPTSWGDGEPCQVAPPPKIFSPPVPHAHKIRHEAHLWATSDFVPPCEALGTPQMAGLM